MSAPDPLRVSRIREIPVGCESFICLAYVPPDSALARHWPDKGRYAVYEYTAWAPRKHTMRWGDGDGQQLVEDVDQDSIQLLAHIDEFALNALFTRACMERPDVTGRIPRAFLAAPSPPGALRLAMDDRNLLDAVVRGEMSGTDAARIICSDAAVKRFA